MEKIWVLENQSLLQRLNSFGMRKRHLGKRVFDVVLANSFTNSMKTILLSKMGRCREYTAQLLCCNI